jgi:Fur family transcriptional regulator, iron response regulator
MSTIFIVESQPSMRAMRDNQEIAAMLRSRGIAPTSQRIDIAALLLSRQTHLSADEVFQLVNREHPAVSKATVYNTLALFVERGLIRQVIADPNRIYYDSNTEPHHHIYDTVTGKLTDIKLEEVQIRGLPSLPPEMQIEGVDVILRVRSK